MHKIRLIPKVKWLRGGGVTSKIYKGQEGWYVIRPGDTLSQIAQKYNTSVQQIQALNPDIIKDIDHIQAGVRIKIGSDISTSNNSKNKISEEQREWNEAKLNKGSDFDIINYYQQNKDGYYLVEDKINETLHLCQNGTIIKSYKILGPQYAKDDDIVTISDGQYGGNLTFPAGVFYVNRTGDYHGSPAYMRRTKEQVQSNSPYGIPNSIHAGNIQDSRGSNGCTRMTSNDIKDLSRYIKEGNNIPCYVLPANPNNRFFIRNGELQFKSSDYQKVAPFNTIVYDPIASITWSKSGLPKEADIDVVKNFGLGLISYKQKIQEDLGINSDTYNKLAKYALGILGVETTFGKTNNIISNIAHGVRKVLSHSNSSPDYVIKYKGIFGLGAANKSYNSIGLTQIRLDPSCVDQTTLDLINQYEITPDDLVYNPRKAAAATMLILCRNYLTMGQTVERAVQAWNKKSTYLDQVKKYSDLFHINVYS